MTQHLSHWELQQNSQNIWHGINCMNGRAEVIKHMGCWMLEIKFDTGKVHISSHNTRDEAMREAEMRACWEVEFIT